MQKWVNERTLIEWINKIRTKILGVPLEKNKLQKARNIT